MSKLINEFLNSPVVEGGSLTWNFIGLVVLVLFFALLAWYFYSIKSSGGTTGMYIDPKTQDMLDNMHTWHGYAPEDGDYPGL